MQGWTGSSDEEQCCPSALGAVGSGETLARRTLKRTSAPLTYAWFKREDFIPKNDGFSNDCGTKDGLSVDRRDTLTDEQIYQRSNEFARIGKNRVGDGAYLIKVETVRNVRKYNTPNQQVLFVYDDPMIENLEHAVIRIAEDVPDEERGILLDVLQEEFAKNHLKPT
jgi:hypothetical protein